MVNEPFFPMPAHLSKGEAQGWVAAEVIIQYELGNMKNFVYLILDHEKKIAAIVDPGKDFVQPLADLEKNNFSLTHILLTHTHHDHVGGVEALIKRFPEVKLRVGEADLHRLPAFVAQFKGLGVLKDEERFHLGSIEVRALHTPGHSAGEFCFFIRPAGLIRHPYLFTGDTIFIRDCGRTDFADGSNEELFHSIQKVKTLPDETILLVGHHYAKECATVLGAEKKMSPPFLCKTVSELAALP